MLYYTSTHADVAESFLLGLSCLVGGDQFYIFISKTDASPKTQSYIAITTVLSTLFLAFILYDEYNRSLFDVTHVLYLVLLVIWGLILYQNVRNPFVTTYYISILGMIMTFLVIISCVHYSHQKELLPSFLSGMLFARLLPTLLWIFVHQKKGEPKLNLSSLSARLALFRLVFCIISMILKFTSGNLDFSQISLHVVKDTNAGSWFTSRFSVFKKIWEHFNKTFINSCSITYFILIMTTPLFLFFSSIVTHLSFPPIVHKFSHLYSHHHYSRIDITRTISHLLGVALGVKYPASYTIISYGYSLIYFGYIVYGLCLSIGNNRFKFISSIHLYTIVILTGFILGYVWSYSLGIIINAFLNPMCCYEGMPSSRACCGQKTERQCYCRLQVIMKELNKPVVTSYAYSSIYSSCSYWLLTEASICDYPNRFSCSKSMEYFGSCESFVYCPNGDKGILLMYYDVDCTKIECCNTQCTGGSTCTCLRLIGIYKVESVTTNACDNCQLTVRLEGSCCDPNKCSTFPCTGGTCRCNNGQCCCICLKCCKQGCNDSQCKCCIHFCKGTGGCSCTCSSPNTEQGVRVFICFENGSGKCCIREIRPNSSKEFTDDLKVQNEFYIKNITFSDCCHVDLKVDLHFTMKNNFFRLTPINYPKKTMGPLSLTLMRNGNECCNTLTEKCCCKNSDLVTVCVKYDGSEKNCSIKCSCKGARQGCCCAGGVRCQCCTCRDGTCCCCCVTCTLNVSRLASFYNKIEPVRVKLVIILWFFFLIFLMIGISSESKDKNKKLKYYQFYPIRSFETVKTYVDNNDMNSMDSVLERLRSVQQNIFLQLFGENDKKNDLDHMFQLFECAFDQCSLNKLRHYVMSKSSMLISSPHYVNRRLNLELVKWSYCVGFVYTYIMLMFFRIQEYFLKWEVVWEREYLNYTRIMRKKFNNITKKSKASISLMCEKGVDHKTTLYTDTSKKGGWGCSHDELDIHANLNERETEMNKSPPHRVDLRLMFFLDKWKHRVENLRFWTENETNVYDWTGFLKEYPGIRIWFFKFFPHIQAVSHELDIPIEKLNKGTEILESKTLNLVS